MTWHNEIYIWQCEVKSFCSKIKRRVWNKHFLLWWYRLWIRKDEFHNSLSRDPDAMMEMNEQEMKEYFADLARRRKKSHQRDLARFKGDNLSFLLNSLEDGGGAERLGALNEKLEEDILQAIRRAGLNITKEHFRAIMRIWGIEEIEAMMRIRMKNPRREGLYKFISPEAKKWNRDFVTTLLKFVSLEEYRKREKKLDKILP